MKPEIVQKYQEYRPLELKDRTWPNNSITRAPRWCSVDLRDGNQALVYPMEIREKTEFFNLLVEIGFKEIEVGFPAAADVEYNFLRHLVDNRLVPEDVTVQILTQAREHLIRKSFDALAGVRRAIVHMYNSTSTLQRDVVFGMSRAEIKKLAVDGIRLVKELAVEYQKKTGTIFELEYSPESFTGTEIDYAVEICAAVMDVWEPTTDRKIILNLPSTVEMTSPNLYADQIEYFIRHIPQRETAVISLHTHNDRGCGVAATELALMAGADRVEGTLFGNGERTGNCDIVTVALNMLTQGVNPQLDFSDINRAAELYERTTRMPIHERHPYVGDLVFTAFSGSHQDAINKGLAKRKLKAHTGEKVVWAVPYLPIDPHDIGRTYESIIRINSQSGKGGVAYVMEHDFGCRLPKTMHPEFARVVQTIAEAQGGEVMPQEINTAFENEYLQRKSPLELVGISAIEEKPDSGEVNLRLKISSDRAGFLVAGKTEFEGKGNGPLDAARGAIIAAAQGKLDFQIKNYSEHSLGEGSDARAIAYIQIERPVLSLSNGPDKTTFYGVGVSPNISRASIEALVSAVNRAFG
ncbi:MAG: 2-isopropylmalate synthase [Spirochaetes bacterium]|nr:2-isopropylmalate synthase [Spirochaetota bacterium]